ncbi:hypothetical protein BJN45_11005 [Azonexus hydrophilus]|uniref:Uncharacterized protein n=1 Tax=Azonexus hydrophilus TaxID=418702 RepID=A0A1R1I595_9RHOO|nr:ATP-binding protein [Azonexus hydrophilus]OMG53928.1 hypothetical protein BJN45_11005 [Azonexus hydrophilus]
MTQEKKIILLFAALLGGMLLSSRFEDSVRLCITLLLLSGACVFILRHVLRPWREHEAGLHRLIQQLQAAQDEERESLARDLHDGLGQSLTVIGLTAAFLERNADRLNPALLREYAGDLQRDLQACRRQLQEILRPRQSGGLTADELVTALQELVSCWQQRATGIEFQLSMPTALPEVDGEVGLTAYRLVQEALTNVVRHSAARCCRIAVVPGRGELQLRIEDDGRGMAVAANSGLHCGLLGIRERLTKIGGHLSLSGAAGQGMHLQARLPLPNSVARRS